MSLLQDWLESLNDDYQILPSCTHYQSPRSSCRACVDHCPEQAIFFKDGLPVIDTIKCTQCSDCVVACPVQAVEGFLPKRTVVNHELIVSNDEVISLKELLVYYQKRVTRIAFRDEDVSEEWQQKITQANEVLSELGEAAFTIRMNQAAEEPEQMMTRKELFSFWKKDVQSIAKEMAPAKWRFNQDSLDLATYYPNHQFIDFTLDTSRCSLCKACEMLCPQACIELTDNHFKVAPDQCTNCSLCVDICPEQAITITSKISPLTPINYLYKENECVSCEEKFKRLDGTHRMCFACQKKKEFSLVE